MRGINVGGKHVVKMAELRALLSSMGFAGIQTHIQSGNVILQSDRPADQLKAQLEAAIEAHFGFPVPVILRSQAQLNALIASLPFSPEQIAQADAASETVSLYVALFDHTPSLAGIEALEPYISEEERLIVQDADAYLLLHQGMRNARLVQKIGILGPFTMRNWNTLCRLKEMAAI